jgi:hypothetical protein
VRLSRFALFLCSFVLAGAVLGGVGCGARRSLPPTRETPVVLPSAGDLLARIESQRTQVRSLRTIADSEIRGSERPIRASEVLLVEPPRRLRIEVLSIFGIAWILATDGEVLDVYSRQDDTIYRGTPTPELIAEFLPLPLALHELTELLLGRPPERDVVQAGTVAWESETGLLRLTVQLSGGGTETLWFDGTTGLLVRCEERASNGALRFDLRIKAYRDVRGVLLASDLTIVGPGGARVRLAYGRSELNPILSADLFRLRHVFAASEVPLGRPGDLP